MRLLNIKTLPPEGFYIIEPKTGKKLGGMMPFSDAVAQIVAYRRKNGFARSNPGEVTQDLHDFTCARLGNNPDFCSDGTVVVKKKMLDRVVEGARHAAEVISSTATGTAVLADWLGDGLQPVPEEQAQVRSDICTGRLNGSPCPKNQQSGWRVTMAVAQNIHAQMAKKSEAGIKVEGEDQLGTCQACGCHLKLKVHVPFRHIHAHTSDEQMSKFPDFCWIQRELKENQIPA